MSKLIFIKAKTRKKEIFVEQTDSTHFTVSVKEAPVAGKANEAILEALADYFNVPYPSLRIVSGHTSKQKIIEING